MKKKIFLILTLVLIIILLYNFTPVFAPLKGEQKDNQEQVEISSPKAKTIYVSENGWLKLNGTSLINKYNEPIQLKGISSHGLQWYSDVLTKDNLKKLKETWNINAFRIAMYTAQNGYISNPEKYKEIVVNTVNSLIDLDMYVIIDWHTLADNNPNIYKEQAKSFFDEISLLYADKPNVIYEICNEPNGNSVSWNEEIKPYAEEIIPIIRKNSPLSLIIVGTPSWCKELKPVADSPLEFENILYSCHFYANTHGKDLRDEVSKALERKLPIIVSEFGTTDASGNGNVNTEETKNWINFLNEKSISYINWSFSYKDESSAILRKEFIEPSQDDSLNEKDLNTYLTESGLLIKELYKN